MPRKQWAPFEKVNAADVNANLADQSVMVFATTAARDAAIPTPTVGMESAVQASPDLGAPRFWNGSTWTPVSSGVAVPNPLVVGAAIDMASVRLNGGTPTSGTWYQISASLGVNAYIFGMMSEVDPAGASGWGGRIEIGTGGAGSEVVRHIATSYSGSFNQEPTTRNPNPPFGIYIPSGTRIAVRYTDLVGGTLADRTVHLFYSTVTSGTQVEAGFSAPVPANGTTWAQIDATPPKTGGVQVIGFSHWNNTAGKIRFGLGASGSEVAVTGYLNGSQNSSSSSAGMVQWITPFEWTSGSRLAVQADGTNSFDVTVYWRESLT